MGGSRDRKTLRTTAPNFDAPELLAGEVSKVCDDTIDLAEGEVRWEYAAAELKFDEIQNIASADEIHISERYYFAIESSGGKYRIDIVTKIDRPNDSQKSLYVRLGGVSLRMNIAAWLNSERGGGNFFFSIACEFCAVKFGFCRKIARTGREKSSLEESKTNSLRIRFC